MKQQLLNLFLFISLGVAVVALSQPKVTSLYTALFGIRSSSEVVEPSSADEFETYSFPSATLPQNDRLESEYDFSNSWEPSLPVLPENPVYPVYEAAYTETESGSDFAFADLSVPLTAEITTVAAVTAKNPPPFDAMEADFSIYSQNLTFSEVSSVEPLEETVLYEAPKRAQNEPPNHFNTEMPVQKHTRRSIAAPPDASRLSPSPNPLASEVSANNTVFQSMPVAAADIGVGQRFHVEANLVEIVPLPGAETVARVGTEIILGCDILPEAKKIAYFDLQGLPPEVRQKMTDQEIQARQETIVQQVFPMILDNYVYLTLFYCDFASNSPKEQIQALEKRLGDSFEEYELPKLMKQFGAVNRMELNSTLEKLIGSSIDREKALFIRKALGQGMIGNVVKEAEGECTHEEMNNYYEEHKADFFHRARAKWLQLAVNITPSFSKEEARNKLVWMGNQVVGGIPFERVARDHSDGLTAKNGGFNDWVTKGSLVSDVLEQAIFQGPIGVLSPILEDRNGFHIVKVLEREDEYYTPFPQAQTDIKKKIKELRRNKKETEYYAELFRKFQPETYQNNVTNFSQQESKVAMPPGIGTSLHAR